MTYTVIYSRYKISGGLDPIKIKVLPLETLVKKAGARVSIPPGPCVCTVSLFSACLVYFHRGIRWEIWEGEGSSQNISRLGCHAAPHLLTYETEITVHYTVCSYGVNYYYFVLILI